MSRCGLRIHGLAAFDSALAGFEPYALYLDHLAELPDEIGDDGRAGIEIDLQFRRPAPEYVKKLQCLDADPPSRKTQQNAGQDRVGV